MGRHRRGRSRAFSGTPVKFLNGRSIHVDKDAEVITGSADEEICRTYALAYEQALTTPNPDRAAYCKRRLSRCPDRFVQRMKEIENSTPEPCRQEMKKPASPQDLLEEIPLLRRCQYLTDIYKRSVRREEFDIAKEAKGYIMDKCPEVRRDRNDCPRQMNFKRLSLTDIKRVPKKKTRVAAMEIADVKGKWEKNSWCRKLIVPKRRASTSIGPN